VQRYLCARRENVFVVEILSKTRRAIYLPLTGRLPLYIHTLCHGIQLIGGGWRSTMRCDACRAGICRVSFNKCTRTSLCAIDPCRPCRSNSFALGMWSDLGFREPNELHQSTAPLGMLWWQTETGAYRVSRTIGRFPKIEKRLCCDLSRDVRCNDDGGLLWLMRLQLTDKMDSRYNCVRCYARRWMFTPDI
jgi:hypothetical protein